MPAQLPLIEKPAFLVDKEPEGICIRVIGTPAPQGSKKFVGLSKKGHGVLVESSKAVAPWRQDVRTAAFEAMQRSGRQTLKGPVAMKITFTLAKPKSAPKTRVTWPDKKPDVDKLCRSTFDALVQAGVIEDDSRVVRCLAEKVFPDTHEDSLPVPGAVIRVRRMDA